MFSLSMDISGTYSELYSSFLYYNNVIYYLQVVAPLPVMWSVVQMQLPVCEYSIF